jgi:hypothetical protein
MLDAVTERVRRKTRRTGDRAPMSTSDRTNPAFTTDTHPSWWPVLGVHRGPEPLIIAKETRIGSSPTDFGCRHRTSGTP